jgi:hypothetical protein
MAREMTNFSLGGMVSTFSTCSEVKGVIPLWQIPLKERSEGY